MEATLEETEGRMNQNQDRFHADLPLASWRTLELQGTLELQAALQVALQLVLVGAYVLPVLVVPR